MPEIMASEYLLINAAPWGKSGVGGTRAVGLPLSLSEPFYRFGTRALCGTSTPCGLGPGTVSHHVLPITRACAQSSTGCKRPPRHARAAG